MIHSKTLKTTFALTVLASASASFAQAPTVSAPTIYGLLDLGVEYVGNVGANGDSVSRVPTNTNTAPSRLGIRGNVGFGDKMSLVYTAEAGIDPGNGNLNQGGRVLGRQVFVGINSGFGTVSIGRQYTMTFWSGLDADILGGGIYGTGSLDSYLPNARADNAVVWMNRTNGWTLGAEYSFGRDGTNAAVANPAATNCAGETIDSACKQWSALVKYDTPTWGVAFSTDSMNGGGATTFGGLNTPSKTDTRTVLNGWFKMGAIKVGGGVINRNNDGSATLPKSNLMHLGLTTPVSDKWTLAAQYVGLQYDATSDFNSALLAVRGTYSLFKGADAFIQVGNIQNNSKAGVSVSGGATGSNPAAGKSQSAFNIGARYAF